jgi:hypothetical protein
LIASFNPSGPQFNGNVSFKNDAAKTVLQQQLIPHQQTYRDEAARMSAEMDQADNMFNPFASNKPVPEEDADLEEDSPIRHKPRSNMDDDFARER